MANPKPNPAKGEDLCEYPRCRREYDLTGNNRRVCNVHHALLCKDESKYRTFFNVRVHKPRRKLKLRKKPTLRPKLGLRKDWEDDT